MRIVALFLLAAFAYAGDSYPPPRFTDPDRVKKLEATMPEIDEIFRQYATARKVTGLVWGVVIDGRLAHVGTAGVRDRVSNAPVAPDTAFRIASMSKSFAVLAALKLRDEGKLSLDDPLSKWIPEFARMPLPTRDSAPLKVRHIMSHSTGFPEDNPWGDQQLNASDADMTGWLRLGIPFSTPPDTRYEYSNYAFGLLGRVVAKASGEPYEKYVTREILGKLHMDASTFQFSDVPAARRAVGYRIQPDGSYLEEPPLPQGAFSSAGGLLDHGGGHGQVRRVSSLGVAAARRCRSRPRAPQLGPRDGAYVDARQFDGIGHGRQVAGAGIGLRIRPAHFGGLPLRAHRGPRRRTARVRFVHDVAAGLRGRAVCHGEPHLLRPDGADQSRAGHDAEYRRAAAAGASAVTGVELDARAHLEFVEVVGRRGGEEDRRDEFLPGRSRSPAARGDRQAEGGRGRVYVGRSDDPGELAARSVQPDLRQGRRRRILHTGPDAAAGRAASILSKNRRADGEAGRANGRSSGRVVQGVKAGLGKLDKRH